MKPKYFPALDGLRCLAIVIVMIAHANVPLLRSGGIGVDIFFALSGYLITSILLSEFDRFGSINFINFYARRFLRLLPCLGVAVVFVLCEKRIATGHWPIKDILPALGYVMNWAKIHTKGDHFLLGQTWSLAIEEQFYMVWPLVITMVCLATPSRLKRFGFFLGLALALALYRTLMVKHFSGGRIYYGSDTHSDGLVLGSSLAFLLALLPDGRLPEAWSKRVAYIFSPLAVLALLAVMAKWKWWDDGMGRFGFTLVAIASVTILLDLVAGSHSLFRGVLAFGPAVWLGKISYGLYLLHLPIYHAMDDFHVPGGAATKLLIGAPLTVAAAALSYYTIEKKFLTWKDRFTRPAKSVVKPAPVEEPEVIPNLDDLSLQP